MGLTKQSTGIKTLDEKFEVKKNSDNEKVIAFAGNPNVGKSTIFNALTGLKQHTGNWPGKTIANAIGEYNFNDKKFILVDIPGTYSLMANSEEEVIARDFLCFGNIDAIVVVVDATCLERNLNLVLQAMEINSNVIVCVNLMDEAKRKGIEVDLIKLSSLLGVAVVGTSASINYGLDDLSSVIYDITYNNKKQKALKIKYDDLIEESISIIEPEIKKIVNNKINSRWLSIKLLESNDSLLQSISNNLNIEIKDSENIVKVVSEGLNILTSNNITNEIYIDSIVTTLIKKCEKISKDVVTTKNKEYNNFDRKIDKVITSKIFGIPLMILLLGIIFWITITGANYPSQLLSKFLFYIQDKLTNFFVYINAPIWVEGLLVQGIYRSISWVVSVMLPPMAIFFPLFTLLEDFGYLPRVAFNLDNFFKKCSACGKQSLTMCMGFGCNAAGVIGCRIIDSPRERLIAIITNNFVPCNGRFPILIAVITMFFANTVSGPFKSLVLTLILMGIILLGVLMTFIVSKILSKTVLKGVPSSFTLELPPYRKPQILKVIVRSIFDRTLFLLGRAIIVAAPAGAIIWLMANLNINDISILNHFAEFLNPFAYFIGLDGFILVAFILAFPANELIMPLIIMGYMSSGALLDLDNMSVLKNLLLNNNWTWLTATCVMLFTLMHWPCSTTCLTIKKETQSLKWTILSFLIPTVIGVFICFVFTSIVRFLNII